MKVQSGIEIMLSAGFGEKLTVAGWVTGDGERPSIHNLLQSDGKSTDLEGLLLLLGWLRLLQV